MLKTSKKDQNPTYILGVRIDSTSMDKVLRQVQDFVRLRRKFYITTSNPEIIVEATKDNTLKKIINSADISIPDGAGLLWAHKFLNHGQRITIIKGRKLFIEIIKLANRKSWRVYLLGGKDNEAAETAEVLARNYKSVKLKTNKGALYRKNLVPVSEEDKRLEKETEKEIENFRPHLIFVAMKFPRQEKWIAKYLPIINATGAMTVGGTFRYVSGKSSLPPKLIDKMNLEWLWRLIKEPRRLRRIFAAIIIFPLLVLKSAVWKTK